MGVNDRPDNAQSYDQIFLVQIKDIQIGAEGGPWEGLYVYSWREQTFDTDTALPVDAAPYREGVYTPDPLVSLQPALDPNNARYEIDSYVYIRAKGYAADAYFYEVVGGGAGGAKSYIVKLTGEGVGIDGGVAWQGLIQKEVDGAVVDGDIIGFDPANRHVLYATKDDEGGIGLPEAGDIVVAIPDPILPGRWLFIPKLNNGVDCNDCSWFAEMSHRACLLIKQLGGSGRCGCVPADSGDGTPAVYMDDFGGWLALRMGTVCCGCGGLVFKTVACTDECTGADVVKAVLELHRYHVSCEGGGSGGGGDVFTKNLLLTCCGRDKKTGQPFAVFAGWGTETCTGEIVGCSNVFTIRVSCSSCPDTNCTCSACLYCCSGATPYGWYLDESEFSNNQQNGLWILETQNDGPCHWLGNCEPGSGGGGTSELTSYTEENPDPLGPPIIQVWHLDHLGTIYELVDGWACCDTNEMEKVSGSGPDTIHIHPITIIGEDGQPECPECEPTWPSTVYLEILELELIPAPIGGGLPCTPWHAGDIIALSQIFGPGPHWYNHVPSEMEPCCNPGFGDQGGNVGFSCNDETLGCQGFGPEFTGPNCGPQSFTLIDCQCDPLYYEGEGIYTVLTSTGDCCGPAGAQIRMRVRVTA